MTKTTMTRVHNPRLKRAASIVAPRQADCLMTYFTIAESRSLDYSQAVGSARLKQRLFFQFTCPLCRRKHALSSLVNARSFLSPLDAHWISGIHPESSPPKFGVHRPSMSSALRAGVHCFVQNHMVTRQKTDPVSASPRPVASTGQGPVQNHWTECRPLARSWMQARGKRRS